MTAVLAFLRIAWPYLLSAAIAGLGVHELDQIPYARLQTTFASYKAQVADANEKAQQAATDALQAQINARLTTEANNGKVISQIQSERDAAVADAQFAKRLLAAAQARPAATGDPVPTTAGGSGSHGAASAPGNRPTPEFSQLIADSATECRVAIQRLTALQLELAPQLK